MERDDDAWDGTRLRLDRLGAPALVIDARGRITGSTAEAEALLRRVGAIVDEEAARLPAGLAAVIEGAPPGSPLPWCPAGSRGPTILCTSLPLGVGHSLVTLREDTSAPSGSLDQRLHQQRLELTGRLVASSLHDLRAPLTSIVYAGEVLTGTFGHLTAEQSDELVSDIMASAQRMRGIADGLLGFARMEAAAPDSSLLEVFDRVSELMRPILRREDHRLRTYLTADARSLPHGGFIVEQILVNLILNAVEAADAPLEIQVVAELSDARPGMVRVRVRDDGPGIPPAVRPLVFQPFFTTKAAGTGLGLTTARDSARDQGGDLILDELEPPGASFSLYLPAQAPS
ncbi:MAG: HAMP domain-containing histidine kinase [Sandaracinaceae bacterium]|nr:HAMP domain-containing histidine kinase [Sandaracinaceae bacterium]